MPAPSLADALATLQVLAEQDDRCTAKERDAIRLVIAYIEHGTGYMRIVARHPETGEEFEASMVSKERGE